MKRVSNNRTLRLIVLAAVAALVGLAGASGQTNPAANRVLNESNFCAVCHSDTEVEFQASTHLREGVQCVDCHGGDPRAQTIEGAHSKNFHRSFDRKQIVELCSSCHSDPDKMKPYGIPIDQRALYFTSVHGKKLMEGDSNVAVCSDCHGAHKVLAATDPKSPVYRENIPQTCGRCHENADLMKSYNLPSNVVSEYRQSVHGQALLERHNRQAPECTRCHGTHGAAPPGIGNVALVCGQCHTKTLDAFRAGPHKTAMAIGAESECASCHSNHRIEHAGHQMWLTSCTQCHGDSTPEAERGRKIQALFTQADDEMTKARAAVDDAKRIPLDVADYETRLTDSLTYLVEARPVSHDLAVEQVEDLTRRSRSISLEVQSDIHEKLGVFRGRIIVLVLIWFYILISIAVIFRYRRSLEGRKASTQSNLSEEQ
jgi:hypothetical protein